MVSVIVTKIIISVGKGVQDAAPSDVRPDRVHLGSYGAVVPRDA